MWLYRLSMESIIFLWKVLHTCFIFIGNILLQINFASWTSCLSACLFHARLKSCAGTRNFTCCMFAEDSARYREEKCKELSVLLRSAARRRTCIMQVPFSHKLRAAGTRWVWSGSENDSFMVIAAIPGIQPFRRQLAFGGSTWSLESDWKIHVTFSLCNICTSAASSS